MGSLLPQLLATGLVGALAPVPAIVALTLLMSKGGAAKASGFAIGLIGAYVAIGAIVLATANPAAGGSAKGNAVVGTIILVLGVVFVIMAIRQLLDAPDPDAAPPKFMSRLDSLTPLGSFAVGVALALINVKQLGVYAAGVSQIVAAHLPTGQAWLALVLFLVIFQLVILAVLIAYFVARGWASQALGTMREWLVAHNRIISIVLGFVIGAGFVLKGITAIVAA